MANITSISVSNHHDDRVTSPSDDDMNPDCTMILLKKFTVDRTLFNLVKSEFNEIYPHLLVCTDYTPVDLIGEPVWTDLTGLAQRQAIHCLKHLATLPDARLIDMFGELSDRTWFQIDSEKRSQTPIFNHQQNS